MQAILDHLKSISLHEVTPLLDAKHAVDSSAGIIIVSLPEEIRSSQQYVYHFHAARVLAGKASYVNPHFHKVGEEPYLILSGSGEMNLGYVQEGKVVWKNPQAVRAGDIIEVQENVVHSLRNSGDDSLDFAFACPDNHLVDNNEEHTEGDRYFTKDLEDGIPSWYPKT